jgi:hypothetical protein
LNKEHAYVCKNYRREVLTTFDTQYFIMFELLLCTLLQILSLSTCHCHYIFIGRLSHLNTVKWFRSELFGEVKKLIFILLH